MGVDLGGPGHALIGQSKRFAPGGSRCLNLVEVHPAHRACDRDRRPQQIREGPPEQLATSRRRLRDIREGGCAPIDGTHRLVARSDMDSEQPVGMGECRAVSDQRKQQYLDRDNINPSAGPFHRQLVHSSIVRSTAVGSRRFDRSVQHSALLRSDEAATRIRVRRMSVASSLSRIVCRLAEGRWARSPAARPAIAKADLADEHRARTRPAEFGQV